MKYAAAMALAGELVSAEDANHETFKRLVPLCPECKSPVYFRQAQDRVSTKGKPYSVPAHWCHFQTDLEQAVECEKRVAKYTLEDKNKIKSKARNQRLKWLQRGFWGIFKKYYKKYLNDSHVEYNVFDDTLILDGDLIDTLDFVSDAELNHDSLDREFDNLCQCYIKLTIGGFPDYDYIAENRNDTKTVKKLYSLFPEIQEKFITNENNVLNAAQYINYIKEVFVFLFTPRMKDVKRSIYYFVLLEYAWLLTNKSYCCSILENDRGKKSFRFKKEFLESVENKSEYNHRISYLFRRLSLGLIVLIFAIPWDHEFSYLKEHGTFSKTIPEGYDYSNA